MEAPLLNCIFGVLGVLLLLGFAPNVLVLCAPVSLPVVTTALLCLAIGAGDPRGRQPGSIAEWCCLPFAISFTIVVLGIVFNHGFWPQSTAPLAIMLLQLCVAAHLLVAIGMFALAENWRTGLFLLGWTLLQGLATFCTYFVSYISVTGDAL
jgi:hypothetical protein